MRFTFVVALSVAAACSQPFEPTAIVEGGDDDITTLVFDANGGEPVYDRARAGPVNDLGFTFARVGVRFTADSERALELRTSLDGSMWSPWAQPSIYFSEQRAHAGHLDVRGPPARFVQHRIAEDAATPAFVVIEPVREIPAPIPAMAIDAVASSTVEQGLNVTIGSRASWGASAPSCQSFTGVSKATVHHTAGANDDSTPVTVQLRQIQSFHQNTRGWCDVGYNYLISRDGRIWEGRGYGVLGAHAENANADNMGISFIGTYSSNAPPMVMQGAAAKLLRSLKDRAGIPLARTGDNGVKGHRQRGTTSTTCPGDALYARLGPIVAMAKDGDFDSGPAVPAGCRSGDFDGEFCDDDGSGVERSHDRLRAELGVNFHCADIEGEPAFCGARKVTRAQSMFVLGRAAGVPVNGHPNAFSDDDGHVHEKYLNAAKAFDIFIGGSGMPDGKASRSTLAIMMKRMYLLPASDNDFFDDDDGDPAEDAHNRAAAAGLFTGYTDANGGRKDFKGGAEANRDMLAVLAVRAFDEGLVPVWSIPQVCIDGTFAGNFCDDDTNPVAQASHDRLIDEAHVPGMFCRPLAGSPRFCASDEASRAMSLLILGGSAAMPLAGHADGFDDDDDHVREAYFNAAKAYGVVTGYDGGTKMKPSLPATRDMLAVILSRMYALPSTSVDAFTDDDGAPAEAWHNKVGAAGLFTGYADGSGGFEFRGDRVATKGQLATLAQRAKDAALVPLWGAPSALDNALNNAAPEDDAVSVPDDDAAPVDLGSDDPSINDPSIDVIDEPPHEAVDEPALEDQHGAIIDESVPASPTMPPPVEATSCSNLGSASWVSALVFLGAIARYRRRWPAQRYLRK